MRAVTILAALVISTGAASAQGTGFVIGEHGIGTHSFGGETKAEVQTRQAHNHWHRAPSGGEDLTQPDGSVIAMVRRDHAKSDKAWVAFAQVEKGGEDFAMVGKFRTEAEAKAALVEIENAQDAKDEE